MAAQHYATAGSNHQQVNKQTTTTIQKLNNKQLIMKKPGTAGGGGGQRNQNNLVPSHTIDSTNLARGGGIGVASTVQMGNPNQQIMIQRENTTVESINHDSRPCSAIKKKSSGISPNSKVGVGKSLHILNSGNRQTSSKPGGGKQYQHQQQHSRYDALNPPKYIQFKSRDTQHKKTNSYSVGGLSAAFS